MTHFSFFKKVLFEHEVQLLNETLQVKHEESQALHS